MRQYSCTELPVLFLVRMAETIYLVPQNILNLPKTERCP
ncbi:MAG: hypothetical protein K0Q90_4317 [Paenibacillaceae bacterium]|nr:hypothetical protein [Paenibacillaceae bacterium]